MSAEENARLGLPCGGHLTVFLQCLIAERDLDWLSAVLDALAARQGVQRSVSTLGDTVVRAGKSFAPLTFEDGVLQQSFGPRQRLLLVGAGQLAASVAELAIALDYDVFVCDPRESARNDWRGPSVPVLADMPDDAVREHASDSQSVVITLTHDPRIDDMALMEALESDTWYVGALGSQKTTDARRERLKILGLSQSAIARLNAPVGMDIGSKTPLEIAISILAELTKLRRRSVDSF